MSLASCCSFLHLGVTHSTQRIIGIQLSYYNYQDFIRNYEFGHEALALQYSVVHDTAKIVELFVDRPMGRHREALAIDKSEDSTRLGMIKKCTY
jgi:hypothetical protein